MYQKLMLHNLLLPLYLSVPLGLFKASEDAQQLGLSDYERVKSVLSYRMDLY